MNFINVFMDPIKLAEDFKRLMNEAEAPIIAYMLISRDETTNHARVLTTRVGLEELAKIHLKPVNRVRTNLFHIMCLKEHYDKADKEAVLSIEIKTSAGYDLSAYAFQD
jgi:hypothetical protein